MHTLDELLAQSPIFAGLPPDQLEFLAGCGRNAVYEPGEFLFRAGEPADTFHLVRRGHVAISTHVTGRGDVTIDTADIGDLVGWGWLFEPYVWDVDARAMEGAGVIAFDAACMRSKFAGDPALALALMTRFTHATIDHLQHTRMQLLDLYGHHPRD